MDHAPKKKPAVWKRVIVIVCGLFIILATYKMHEIGEQEAWVQAHSPLVKMEVTGREKGLGTARFPNKIFLHHQGKNYTVSVGNRYFRQTSKADTLEMHFDPISNIAVRPEIELRSPKLLLASMLLAALLLISAGVFEWGIRE